MQTDQTEISVKGKAVKVAALTVGGHKVVCEGRWLKIAQIFDEPWLDAQPIQNPPRFIDSLRDSPLHADIFTFGQMLPDTTPRHPYQVGWDNVAVAPTSDFQVWWQQLPQESRKNVRKAHKRGITIEPVEFNDDLAHGIKGIYDETPIRQGRRFWHYGKDFETVKRENSSYLERSQFIGAFLGGELIGFLKMVYTGSSARIMQILSKNQHYDKHPMNALLATAVELCSRKPVSHLIYGQYVYGNKRSSSVTEFKRRNGFQEVLMPRYYVPLTLKGRVATATGCHRGLGEILPEPVTNMILDLRMFTYKRFSSRLGSLRAFSNGS